MTTPSRIPFYKKPGLLWNEDQVSQEHIDRGYIRKIKYEDGLEDRDIDFLRYQIPVREKFNEK